MWETDSCLPIPFSVKDDTAAARLLGLPERVGDADAADSG